MARSKHADKGVAMLMYDISWLLHGILYRNYPELPVTAGVGLGFWVVPSSHMLKTEFLCHFSGKGFFHLKKKHFEISPLKPLNGVQL